MRRKVTFVVGFGVGYVLGARAGRGQYDSIVRTVRRAMDHPAVQSTAGMLRAQAANALHSAKHRLGVTGGFTGEARWRRYDEPAVSERRP